jgi:hypothetical protein
MDKEEPDDQEGEPEAKNNQSLEDMLAAKNVVHREYKVMVDTGQMPRSYTHGDVFIQLLGSRGKSGLMKLKTGFNARSRLEFSLFTVDVGRVDKIRLVASTSDRWFCDRVWLVAPEGNREFPVGQFLGFPNQPEIVVGPALAALGAAGVPLALALEVMRAGAFVTTNQKPATFSPRTAAAELEQARLAVSRLGRTSGCEFL